MRTNFSFVWYKTEQIRRHFSFVSCKLNQFVAIFVSVYKLLQLNKFVAIFVSCTPNKLHLQAALQIKQIDHKLTNLLRLLHTYNTQIHVYTDKFNKTEIRTRRHCYWRHCCWRRGRGLVPVLQEAGTSENFAIGILRYIFQYIIKFMILNIHFNVYTSMCA